MRLRGRRNLEEPSESEGAADPSAESETDIAPTGGPWDASQRASWEGYLDFGSLLVPVADVELRLNVDQASGSVISLAWLADDAGLEVSVFAAPRSPGVWDELRPDLIADATARGGSAEETEGPYGAEVVCTLPVQLPDGTAATQITRIFAHQGDRWLLRGNLMGRAVAEPEVAAPWYALFGALAVRRGNHAMPVGGALELRLPPEARLDPTAMQGGVQAPGQSADSGSANDG